MNELEIRHLNWQAVAGEAASGCLEHFQVTLDAHSLVLLLVQLDS